MQTHLVGSLVLSKSDIWKSIKEAIDHFHAETGLTPSQITVEMVEITSQSSELREFAVANVRVQLPSV